MTEMSTQQEMVICIDPACKVDLGGNVLFRFLFFSNHPLHVAKCALLHEPDDGREPKALSLLVSLMQMSTARTKKVDENLIYLIVEIFPKDQNTKNILKPKKGSRVDVWSA